MQRFKNSEGDVEAVQYTGSNIDELFDYLETTPGNKIAMSGYDGTAFYLTIQTPEGTQTSRVGDWLVKYPDGTFRFVRDATMRHTYDRIAEPPRTVTVYVSIGNSDDKLSQAEWCTFAGSVYDAIFLSAHVHGSWYSLPNTAYQNACWCFEISEVNAERLKRRLDFLREQYRQDSIAWAEARTEFIGAA